MAEPGFWDDQQAAQKVIGETNRMKVVVNPSKAFNAELDDMTALLELVEEMGDDPDAEAYEQEVIDALKTLAPKLDALELASFLTGPHDGCNALLTINSGAGGTESCDWADMLLRMYTRWGERAGYTVDVQDIQPGEEAGISSATLRIEGPNAYGYAKAERGVHRLVRIGTDPSVRMCIPFPSDSHSDQHRDSNARRHTSFSSVDVVAEIEDDIDMDIPEAEIRTDVYRASGKV